MEPTLPAVSAPRPSAAARRRAARRVRVSAGPTLQRPKRTHEGATAGAGIAASVIVHGLILAVLLTTGLKPRQIEAADPVELAVIEKEKPPPPPPPPPPEEKKPEPPKVVKVKPKAALPEPPKNAPPPPPVDAPPPPNEPPPPDAKPQAPIMIGVTMSSTTTAGGFAAPVGNSLYGAAPQVAPKPEEVKPYSSPNGRYVPPYKVTRIPEMLEEVKATYPEEARKLGLEGQVVLRLTIDGTGKVARASVLKGPGHGFDEAALEAIRRFRFKPGMLGDEPITTEITYTYTFILD